MNDFQRVLSSLENRNEPCLVATVVHTEGSTYRRAGARMVIFPNGASIGAISGGCLESDVIERSASIFADGIPKLLRYDALSEEDDLIFGLGMGCNGITTVFVERLSGSDDPFCEFIRHCGATRQRGSIATVYTLEAQNPHETLLDGHRFFLYHSEEAEDNWGESGFASRLREWIWDNAASALNAAKPHHVTFNDAEGTAHILIEPILPTRELVIMGAGYDALPLVEYASVLGWRSVVLDHRPALLGAERFPKATLLQRTTRETFAEAAHNLACTPETAIVIMTHNLALDAALLREALRSKAGYVGLLGPKPRLGKILTLLAEQGFMPTEEVLAQLHNPIGLDIGSETAEEVALSIIAEIQAVMNNRDGGLLKRRRQEKIH